MRYEKWKWKERRARRGQVVNGSGYDRLSLMLRQVEAFRVLRAGMGQSGKVVEILKARRPIIFYVSFLWDELRLGLTGTMLSVLTEPSTVITTPGFIYFSVRQ